MLPDLLCIVERSSRSHLTWMVLPPHQWMGHTSTRRAAHHMLPDHYLRLVFELPATLTPSMTTTPATTRRVEKVFLDAWDGGV